MTKIDIRTEDGICPSHVYRPSGSGPWPAVLVFMDGVGIRPAMLEVGERLATDGPESPHLLAPKMKSKVYVAGAIEDATFPDVMKDRLEGALTEAGVDHTIETYPAKHGWVFRDLPVYDAAASERHWKAMVAPFDGTLIRSST